MKSRRVHRLILSLGLLAGIVSHGLGAQEVRVDHARVTSENRQGKTWYVLDSQATVEVAASADVLLGVITDYEAYPTLSTKVREAKTEVVPGAVLLTQKVVVSALGIDNVNRFTIRIVRTDGSPSDPQIRLDWSQVWTDGSIDSVSGSWVLQELGSPQAPRVRVVYRTRSAVPQVILGQDLFLRMFFGGETKAWLEAVAKKALSR